MKINEMSEAQLLAELDFREGSVTVETWSVKKLLVALELQRRRIEDLTKSSGRLEKLTKWLIGLTVVLALLTAVLAGPEIKNLTAWLRTP